VRTELDALLSVQRWAASFLPEPWDVRRVLESGEEPARPYALIEYLGSADTAGAPAMQDVTVAFTLNLYLPEAESRQAADDVALALRETVWLAAKVGPNVRRPKTGPIVFDATAGDVQAALDAALPAGVTTQVLARGRGVFDVHFGGTLLGAAIDLLDIDTASLTGPGTVTELLRGAPAPWRSDRDFMRVTSFGQTTLRDPDNPKLAMVAVDLRCAFTRGLPVAWDAMLLQSVTVRDKLTGAH
jgi:hypothetical protein